MVHPLHPALAHFPLAFWLGSFAADLIGLRTGSAVWWTVSHHALAAGAIMGAVTVLAGGFCGGTLVYGYGVGVSWRAERGE